MPHNAFLSNLPHTGLQARNVIRAKCEPGGTRGARRTVEVLVGDPKQPSTRHRDRATPAAARRGTLARVCMTLLAVIAMLAVLATGAGWWMAHGMLGGITVSQALGSEDPKSSGGAINILLIGLDSRKDQDGNDLPWALLNHLHAGDSEDGGYNTNTLILVHVGTDDRVSAFSIPRD